MGVSNYLFHERIYVQSQSHSESLRLTILKHWGDENILQKHNKRGGEVGILNDMVKLELIEQVMCEQLQEKDYLQDNLIDNIFHGQRPNWELI